MKSIEFEDVFCAYRKLKSMAYHDNSDLGLKAKIAKFESNSDWDEFEDPHDKLMDVCSNLADGKTLDSGIYWENKISQIHFYAMPKEVMTFGDYEKEKKDESDILIKNIFTNKRSIDDDLDYKINKLTLFIDAPVEIYILSILWIMKLGYYMDVNLDEKCFGNRLLIKTDDKKESYIVKDDGLFKPYYKQYQRWRDEGISTAKHYLDKGENVIFINLDIKDYYYSVRITKDLICNSLKKDDLINWTYINDLFWDFHIVYSEIVKRTSYPNKLIDNIKLYESILPIGMPSSYVLANWYLTKFDKEVNELINPVYYSRYVDDIFIVTANNDIEFELQRKFDYNPSETKELDSMSKTEKYISNRLNPILKLVPSPFNPPASGVKFSLSDYVFQLRCSESLYIQASKTLVYFFDSKFSLALLDKFKDELEKRSSEFRFLPDDELNKSGFDEEAYELVFDDSQHKIKTLKDYKENRYGISSHLSKKIFYTLRNGNKGTDEDAKKIIKFFKGTTNLEHFRQWERLLTYFLINDKLGHLFEFISTTFNQLEYVKLNNSLSEWEISDKKVRTDLTQQFIVSIEMVLALNPGIDIPVKIRNLISDNQNIQTFSISQVINEKTEFLLHNALRRANLIRHNYVNIPLLNYLNGDDKFSLLTSNLEELHEIGQALDINKIKYSPRKVRFSEVAWMQCILLLVDPKENNTSIWNIQSDYTSTKDDITYLHQAFEIYYAINYWNENSKKFKDKVQKSIFDYVPMEINDGIKTSNLVVHEISVNPKGSTDYSGRKLSTVKVGLVNMKVEASNYEASMLGKPNLGERYQDFAKILNMAEKENCDVMVLPELALPISQVRTFLDYSRNHQRLIVTGLEHLTQVDVAYNFVLTILPFEIMGIKDAVPIMRLKNHYSPQEKFWIEDYRRIVPLEKPYRYHLYRWRGLYFSVYYCFELSDLFHRSLFKSKVDFIIASEWNPDTNYFSNIAEVSARDLHCYFVQVNTNQYGDSRIIQPSKTESKDILRIKGGKNTALLVDDLEIAKLRTFQYKGFGQQKDDKEFKPTPADYNSNDVRKRQENKSFAKKTIRSESIN